MSEARAPAVAGSVVFDLPRVDLLEGWLSTRYPRAFTLRGVGVPFLVRASTSGSGLFIAESQVTPQGASSRSQLLERVDSDLRLLADLLAERTIRHAELAIVASSAAAAASWAQALAMLARGTPGVAAAFEQLPLAPDTWLALLRLSPGAS
jgi:hypothetical protein